MVRVDLEGLGQCLVGLAAIIVGKGAGEQVVEPGILGGVLGGFLEGLGGQGGILLLQGQLGRGVEALGIVGMLFRDEVVELVEHLAGVGASEEEEPTRARGGLPGCAKRWGAFTTRASIAFNSAVASSVRPLAR